MPELKVGLAPNRTSYYDEITNTYITLRSPVQVVKYTDYRELKKITHALFASQPALVLYEGEIPEEAINEWKEKYMKPFKTDVSKLMRTLTGDLVSPVPNRAFDRTEKLKGKAAEETAPDSAEEVEEVSVQSVKNAKEEVSKKEAVKEATAEKEEDVKAKEVKEAAKEAPKKGKAKASKSDK